MKKNQKRGLLLFQIAATLIFLYLTFHNTHINGLKSAFLAVNYWILSLALVPQLFSLFFLTIREKYLLNKIFSFQFRDLFEGVVIGFVGNNVLPFRSGEFLKVLYWSKKSEKSYVSLLSVALLERLLDLIFLIALFFVGSHAVLFQLGINIKWIIVFLVPILFVIGSLIYLDWKYKKQFQLHASLQRLLGESITHYCNDFLNKVMKGFRVLGSTKNIFYAVFFTFLYWTMSVLVIFIFLYAFHLPITFKEIVVILLATTFGAAIPAAPGYIGTYDYFAKMALVLYGVNASVAASFAVVSHAVSIIPLTVAGILFVYPVLARLMKSTKRKELS